MLRLLILLLLLPLSLWAQDPKGGSFGISDVREALERAQELSEELKPHLPEIPEESKREAQRAKEAFERRREEVERFKKEASRLLAGKTPEELLSPRPPEGVLSSLGPDEAVLVFISSSVPLETLRSYARDLDLLGDPRVVMVMRGFVGGMKRFKPTLDFILDVLKEDPDCDLLSQECRVYNASIHIDPLLFRELQVEAVPAVAYVRGLRLSEPTCESGELDAWILYGDVSLEYALRVLAREAESPGLESLADRLFRAQSPYRK